MKLEGDQLAEWLKARAGKLTASRMADALAFRKDGKPAAARVDLAFELLAERQTGDSVRHYVTDAMQYGLDMEPEAIAWYEQQTGAFVVPTGFYDHPTIDNFGATPDGLVDDDGLIECKVPTATTFVRWAMTRQIPDEHKPQMLAQLACTGRKWCDFVAFNPRAKVGQRGFVVRFEPTDAELRDCEAKAAAFLAEVDAMWEVLHS